MLRSDHCVTMLRGTLSDDRLCGLCELLQGLVTDSSWDEGIMHAGWLSRWKVASTDGCEGMLKLPRCCAQQSIIRETCVQIRDACS